MEEESAAGSGALGGHLTMLEERNPLATMVEDGRLGSAVRVVVERGMSDSFAQVLLAHTEQKTNEIKAICSAHYEEFVGAIDELATMQGHIAVLKEDISRLNEDVQSTGREFVAFGRDLARQRQVRANVSAVLEAMRKVSGVFSKLDKVEVLLANKKFTPALKALEQLRRGDLPKLKTYAFATTVEGRVAHLVASVKNQARAEVQGFFDQLVVEGGERKASAGPPHIQIGAYAMALAAEQVTWEKKQRRHQRASSLAFVADGSGGGAAGGVTTAGSVAVADDAEAVAAAEATRPYEKTGIFENVNVDFGPVYACLHVYERLHIFDDYQRFYIDRRTTHLNEVLDVAATDAQDFAKKFEAFFARLAGFFLIEDSVLRSGRQLMPRPQLDKLWELAIVTIKVTVKQFLNDMPPALFLHLKYTIVLFAKCLEEVGTYTTQPLTAFLQSQREDFRACLQEHYWARIDDCLQEEKFQPLVVADKAEYEREVAAFQLLDRAHRLEFPLAVSFSATLPRLCGLLKAMVKDYCEFLQFLPGLAAAADKFVVSCLEETFAFVLQRLEACPIQQISQAAQNSTNAVLLATRVPDYVERYIALKLVDVHHTIASSAVQAATPDGGAALRKTPEEKDEKKTRKRGESSAVYGDVRLRSRAMFEGYRIKCEDALFELVDTKTTSFLSLMDGVDWTPRQPAQHPHGWAQDLVTYLEATFDSLAMLPAPVREAIHFTTFKHISSFIMDALAGRDIKAFNLLAVHDLHRDVRLLESFAQRCPVPNLTETLSELRQFVDLFLSGNVEQILHSPVREERFPHLERTKLATIMFKFKDTGILSSLSTVSGAGRLKKSVVVSVAKRLNQQQQDEQKQHHH